MFKKILLAYDGAEPSRKALETVFELQPGLRPEIHVVSVGRLPEYAESQDEVNEAREKAEEFYRKRLDDAAHLAKERGVTIQAHMAFGKPSERILAVAAELAVDLIVVAVHPHHPLRRRILGGTADKIVDSADCSVLVVR